MPRPRTIDNEQILAATRRVLLKQGMRVTTRGIASEIGISEGVLFQRFGSKGELVRAALSLPEIDAEQLVTESISETDAREVLEDVAVAIFAAFRRLLPFYIPTFANPEIGIERELNSRASPFVRFLAALERHITEERHAGRIRTDSPHRTSYLIVSVLHNAALFEAIAGPSPDISEGNIRDLISVIWQGLEPRT